MTKKHIYSFCMLVILGSLLAGCSLSSDQMPKPMMKDSNQKSKSSSSMKTGMEMKKEEKILAQGMFHDASEKGSGTATIKETSDRKRMLELTGFKTSSGPDVYILLVAAKDVKMVNEIKKDQTITLGKLKSFEGDQSYEIPASVDLMKYQSVSIYCKKFKVNFAAAPLSKTKN